MNYVLCSFREDTMFRAVVEEAAALTSLALFLGMIAIWAQVIRRHVKLSRASASVRCVALRCVRVAVPRYPARHTRLPRVSTSSPHPRSDVDGIGSSGLPGSHAMTAAYRAAKVLRQIA